MINLRITKLSKHYNQPLIDDVTLSHSGKGVVALVGDNGSGKSTLLKIIAKLEEQDGGKIEWSREPIIGYMNQEIVGMDELSGGQQKMAVLADLIYSNYYDVLLLDEPDNHLDIDSKDWLIEAIKSFQGLVIIISHDRHVLKEVSTHTWLMQDREIHTYPFGYEKFIQVYADEKESQEHLFHVQQKEHKRLKELVEIFRLRAPGSVKGAKTFHALEKRLARYEATMIKDPKLQDQRIELSTKISSKQIKNKLAFNIRDVYFSYGDRKILEGASLFAEVGEKIALVSPNGTGKSTLIKMLMGKLEPNSGTAKTGENLKVGYYSQEHLETLPKDSTPLKCMTDRFPLRDFQAAEILKKFHLSKQTIKSKIWTLSGGQKSRLQLALFLYTNPDILILDEPTNHLDLKSVAALEEFLKEYEGSVLLISHDRELVTSVSDLIYEIKSGKIELSKLSYSE